MLVLLLLLLLLLLVLVAYTCDDSGTGGDGTSVSDGETYFNHLVYVQNQPGQGIHMIKCDVVI